MYLHSPYKQCTFGLPLVNLINLALRINNLQSVILRLAVTLAFVSGAVLVTLGLRLLELSGGSMSGMATGSEWLTVTGSTVAYAFLSGLVVDTIRLLFDLKMSRKGAIKLRNIGTLKRRTI